MGIVAGVQQAKPLVIGVDILTDSDDFTNPAYARAAQLKTARARLKENAGVPVVWAASAEPKEGERHHFLPWLFGEHEELLLTRGKVLGEPATSDSERWGVPIFPTERDRAVRRLPRRWVEHQHQEGVLKRLFHLLLGGGTEEPGGRTFAGAVVDPFCGSAKPLCKSYRLERDERNKEKQVPAGHEIFISYGSSVSVTPDYRVRDLFTCTGPTPHVDGQRRLCESLKWDADDTETRLLARSIVLIGGTFGASRDFFDTPGGQRLAGLFVNAHAARAEIDGPVVGELAPLITLGFDVAVGLLISLIFSRDSHVWFGRRLRKVPDAQAWVWVRSDQVVWRAIATGVPGVSRRS